MNLPASPFPKLQHSHTCPLNRNSGSFPKLHHSHTCPLGEPEFRFKGSRMHVLPRVILALQAKRLLQKDAKGT